MLSSARSGTPAIALPDKLNVRRGTLMIQLHDAAQGTLIGTITDEELQFLMDQLEEESAEDRDYYISAPTIDMLEDAGADSNLVEMLRGALGQREGFDIRWTRV